MPESNATPSTAADVSDAPSDAVLSSSRYLTRQEVIRRRSRRVKQLSKCYRAHYWSLMQELKIRYREYYWKYGRSAFQEDEKREGEGVEGTGENLNGHGKLGLGLGIGENGFDVKRCAVSGCKSKAMALTRFCHPHILSDSKQKLYKGCSFVIKSVQAGPVLCGKPILRSTVPSLCPIHFQKAERQVNNALKKAGLNAASSSKLAPKFHVIVAEYVCQIQTKRRAAQRASVNKVEIKEETGC
ncbi:hypothetical protein AAG906_020544 [Vitis piasezkii]